MSSDVPHALARWARAVVSLMDAAEDPRTLQAWGRLIGMSTSHLRASCRLAGVNPKDSLDFGRLLRAFTHRERQSWPLEYFLDYADPRTLRRLLVRAGLDESAASLNPERFICQQQLITNQIALVELAKCLDRSEVEAHR